MMNRYDDFDRGGGDGKLRARSPCTWNAGDTPTRRQATMLCWQCPAFTDCRTQLALRIAADQTSQEQVFAAVAFDGDGMVDPDVHTPAGAAALAAAYQVPVGAGGFTPAADGLPLLTDEQIRDRLAMLDKAHRRVVVLHCVAPCAAR